LPKEKLALFLNRLFSCDGTAYVTRGRGVISYCSSSKLLIYDVQHLLLRFGIISCVRAKNVKYNGGRRRTYELEIRTCEDQIIFCEEIGILSKEIKLNKVYEYAKKAISLNGFTSDTLPMETWELILKVKGNIPWRQLYTKMGLPLTHNIHAWRRNPKRLTVFKIAQALNSQVLEDLATSDIFWDKITSITPMGKKQVYDLTIPETHNFMANDFFVHNTSFALNIAQHVATTVGLPVGIFSLEMSQEELVDRLLVAQADIDAWKLKTGRLDEKDYDRLSNAMGELAEAQLYIDDTPGISLSEIRTKARRLQIEHGLRFLIVDYLQLIHGRNLDNRVQEVAEISQGLKNLARELKIPVLAISQLSRAVEARGTKKPQLSDLRESGTIEQDADVVMFIYREDPEKMESVTLDIQKHRNGSTGEIPLMFRGDRTRFYGMEKARAKPAAVIEKDGKAQVAA
jgi:replicative DNA helicase